jgi:hypothetical protein
MGDWQEEPLTLKSSPQDGVTVGATPQPVVIRGQGGVSITLTRPADLQQMSVKWAYTVRNRIRWATDAGALRKVTETAVKDLASLGLTGEALQQLSEARLIEVAIPFTKEEEGWELRVLPWEFLLATGTKKKVIVARHLDCRQSSARAPRSAAIVASLPGKLQQSGYEFDSETALVRANLPFSVKLWTDPTLAELKKNIAAGKPDVIHLAGVDLHEGHEILVVAETRKDRFLDGYYLKSEDGSAEPVSSVDLADALTAGGAWNPVLVSVNVYNSAARVAAMAVARGAGAAIGFQDEIDNVAAEEFFTRFYRAWQTSDWDLLRSFETALDQLSGGGAEKTGTGVVLWSALSLLDAHLPKTKAAARTRSKVRELVLANDLIPVVDPVDSVNYSLLHNKQSLFQRFTLTNAHPTQAIEGIRLYVELCVGDQNYPCRFRLDLAPGSMETLTDKIRIPLTSTLFRSLREAIRSVLFVRISVGGADLIEKTYPVSLLAIDEWLDTDKLNAFLPSFVLSRDPAILRIVDSAQRHLMTLTDDPDAGFDGYQSVDPNPHAENRSEPVDKQVWALWSALLYDFSISYINPPPSFADSSQRLRSPSDVIEGKRGTCIDLALLLAACLEYVGIYPVIFLLNDHAFPGYWRSEESRNRFFGVEGDPGEHAGRRRTSDYSWVELNDGYGEVTELVRCGDLAPLETVWLTQHKGFWEARDAGGENLRSRDQFESMIDVQRARDEQVTPLPVMRRDA